MINIEPIEAFSDNYIWLVTTKEGSIVIDPGESSKTIDLIKERGLNLEAILIITEILSYFAEIHYLQLAVEEFLKVLPSKCMSHC
jgi:hydroxyacylglutathione hydrolase